MLWTAYLAGGEPPRGAEFVRVVGELAERAGVDAAPIEREAPRDRRAELLEDFFKIAQRELISDRGRAARAYLEQRGFPIGSIETSALGVVPSFLLTESPLRASGYSDEEIKASGLFADGRWPGRLCGAWRNERGRIGTIWARAVDDTELDAARYLYLRGAARTSLPPYGLQRGVRDLALVEGFLDHHQLRAHGVENSAAIGGTATNPRLFERLRRLGVVEVTLCFDADEAGRAATARAVENAARAVASPSIFVATPLAKDPDELVRKHGIEAWHNHPPSAPWVGARRNFSVASSAPLQSSRVAKRSRVPARGSARYRLGLRSSRRTRCGQCQIAADTASRRFGEPFRRGSFERSGPT